MDARFRIPVRDLYGPDGINHLAKRPDQILTAIHVPDRSGWRATYRKLRRRGSIDFPILGVAVTVRLGESGVVEEARIVLEVAHVPVDIEKLHRLLSPPGADLS